LCVKQYANKKRGGDKMKLFEVRNGYIGESVTKCFVIAETEERALELASISFREESKFEYGNYLYDGEKHLYHQAYWTNLKAECLVDDTTKEYRGESRDY